MNNIKYVLLIKHYIGCVYIYSTFSLSLSMTNFLLYALGESLKVLYFPELSRSRFKVHLWHLHDCCFMFSKANLHAKTELARKKMIIGILVVPSFERSKADWATLADSDTVLGVWVLSDAQCIQY